MTTIIRYNGSRFAGAAHASIDALLALMEMEPLDNNVTGVTILPDGMLKLHGNFIRVSHSFDIETNDKNLLASFSEAFRVNDNLTRAKTYADTVTREALDLLLDKTIPANELGEEINI